jgi:uracil-DNA glycosylase
MYVFPFGAKLQKVEQTDRSTKSHFILGVYASAVHAKWIDVSGKVKVKALAVASEPYIFWRGDGVEEVIERLNKNVPEEVGRLETTQNKFNGPSGDALDEKYLKPLKLTREDCWLSDIIPFSRLNPNQQKAIEREYSPLTKKYNLPECTIPYFSKAELNDATRCQEILTELKLSKADTIILLGDEPIKHFLKFYCENKYRRLTDFGDSPSDYGRKIQIGIDRKKYTVIPLAHPRQVNKLGKSSMKWFERHETWINQI